MKCKSPFLIVAVFLISLSCQAVNTVVPTSSTKPVLDAVESSPTPAPVLPIGLVYGVKDSTRKQAIWQVGEDGSPHILIPDRSSAMFSPDGKRAIYEDNFWELGSGCVWLADSVSEEVRPLDCSDTPQMTGDPSIPAAVLGWVPNNPDLVYAVVELSGSGMGGYSGPLGTLSLIDGSKNILDGEHEIYSSDVAISPNGEQLAYGSGIYRVNSGYEDFDTAEYGIKEPYSVSNPSWSPDGRKIAWGVLKEDENFRYSASIGVFDLASKTAEILIPPFDPRPVGETYAPAVPHSIWSPDGQWLAVEVYAQNETGEYDSENSGWWVLRADGSEKYKVAGEEFDSWSPDSQWIVYIARGATDINTLEMYASHPDGSEASKLGELDDFYDSKIWSPDGRYLAFVDHNSDVQIVEKGIWQSEVVTDRLGISGPLADISLVAWIEPIQFSFETMTVLPTPTPQPVFSCANAPRTRLQVGDTARITFTDGSTTRLRSAPEAGDNGVGSLAEGTEFEIVGGPVCYPRPGRNDAYVYWEIVVPSKNNLTGWVAEGDFNGYYIEPWP